MSLNIRNLFDENIIENCNNVDKQNISEFVDKNDGSCRINCMFNDLMEEKIEKSRIGYDLAEVSVRIFEKSYQIILDSGSEINVISNKLLSEMKVENHIDLIPAPNISIVAATGSRHKRVNKQVMLELSFSNFKIPVIFLIVEDLNVDILVGCEFLNDIGAVMDFNKSVLLVKNLSLPFIRKDTAKYAKLCNIKIGNDLETFDILWNEQIENIRSSLVNDSPELVQELIDTFEENRDVFSDQPGSAKNYICELKFKDNVQLNKKSYPIPYVYRDKVNDEIQKMLNQKIIEPASSPYTNSMVVVKKPDNQIRLCLDGRKLNEYLIIDKNTEPEPIDNILIRFNKCNYISSFDLTQGFNQVKLSEESKQYLAFNICGQGYQYTHLPFGLNISSSEFIKCLYKNLGEEVCKFIIAYIDDLAVSSESLEEHIYRLKLLFNKLKEGNLKLKLNKSRLIADQIKYLGYIIDKNGIQADNSKLDAINKFPEPRNLKQLQSFLGLCNYYRKFQKNYSDLTSKFKHLLCKKNQFKWTSKDSKTFQEIKERFIECVVLKHPNFDKNFIMSTDASDMGLGVELFHEEEGEHQVIAYASRSLSKSELNYSISEKECLAVLFGLTKLHNYFGDRKIVVRTDHKALTFIKKCKVGHSRLSRWLLALQNFNIEWEYLPGKDNIVADIISRTDYENKGDIGNSNEFKVLNIIKDDSELKRIILEIKEKQDTDPWIMRIKDKVENGNVNICKYFIVFENLLFCRKSYKNNFWKLCVPSDLQDRLIEEIHLRNGHVGCSKTYKFIGETFYIKGCYRKVRKVLRYCKVCQLVKTVNDKKSLQMSTIMSNKKGHKVFIDVYGELPGGKYKWVCIILDAFTKFVKLYPLVKANAKSLVKQVEKYIAEFGKFEMIVSDNGSCFASKVWKESMQNFGVRYFYISIFHPQSNLSERPLKEVNRILRTYVPENKHNLWYKYLDKAEYIINNNFHESTEHIPIELMENKKLVHIVFKYIKFPTENKFELENEDIRNKRIKARIQNKGTVRRFKYNMKNKKCITYHVGDLVLIKNYVLSNKLKKFSAKLCPKYKGPYEIRKDLKKGCYLLKNLKKYKLVKVNQFMMKPYYTLE